MLEGTLKKMGFETISKVVSQVTLTGNRIVEKRLVAYSANMDVKITYSEYSDGRRKLSILVQGQGATRSREEKLTRIGGKVDFDEGERLYSVIDVKDQTHAEEIINEVFSGTRTELG